MFEPTQLDSTQFEPAQDYLHYLRNTPPDQRAPFEFSVGETAITSKNTGILEITPAPQRQQDAPYQLILSCGIHGNETAPIELINDLFGAIVKQKIHPACRTLLIFGNVAAMQQQVRFIDQNLNRLFCGKHAVLPPDTETARAAVIEQSVEEFIDRSLPCYHYDLHTAIRPSHIEKFALYPFVESRMAAGRLQVPDSQMDLLRAGNIQAVLLQNAPASTFSAHTARQFDAQSFTLELGKVHPFGENDLRGLRPLQQALMRLLELRPVLLAEPLTPEPAQYEVCHEILHGGTGFDFAIPDDAWNFTAYPHGTQIWASPEGRYCVESNEEYIVFPNRHVPKGQRAGLMLKEVCRQR